MVKGYDFVMLYLSHNYSGTLLVNQLGYFLASFMNFLPTLQAEPYCTKLDFAKRIRKH